MAGAQAPTASAPAALMMRRRDGTALRGSAMDFLRLRTPLSRFCAILGIHSGSRNSRGREGRAYWRVTCGVAGVTAGVTCALGAGGVIAALGAGGVSGDGFATAGLATTGLATTGLATAGLLPGFLVAGFDGGLTAAVTAGLGSTQSCGSVGVFGWSGPAATTCTTV